jgi:hypothetical protein
MLQPGKERHQSFPDLARAVIEMSSQSYNWVYLQVGL